MGIFQAKLIIATLATHFTAISPLPKSIRSTSRPTAALILAIQAVSAFTPESSLLKPMTIDSQARRALQQSTTGIKEVLPHPLGDFSKQNWEDHYEIHAGKRVLVKATSELQKVVKKVSEPQWEKITAAAQEEAKNKREVRAAILPPETSEELESDGDFELQDDDKDI
ncbi:hypothetical protein C0991_005006 [Blastosporella zonata]|nr:hypothetical protein C0991_005006 [Blastosporella zonata]